MPLAPKAVIAPELLMPPLKIEIVTDASLPAARPPTKMPFWNARIVPELVMPPEKVEIMTDAAVPVETLAPPPTRMP